MKNEGFTLVELLAVIVILAIIALIAVPIILDIIGSTKKESDERSIELYAKAIENAIADYSLKNNGEIPKDIEDLEIEYEGNRVECSIRKIYENGTISLNKCKVNGHDVDYAYGIYTDNSGANIPDLLNNTLTPVIYNEDHWEVADITDEWYDYNKKEWANAVILKEDIKKESGDKVIIPDSNGGESDVLAMFVWIPRYSYTISSTAGSDKNNPGAIDIKFVDKNVNENGTASYTDEIDNTWYTHPAFDFGGVQLSGIWVGKFETTGNGDNPTILPNQTSLRGQNLNKDFLTAQKFNDKISGDSHMMKNSEWGAAAYLSHSKYGKDGEVYINNCSNYITGIGAETASAQQSNVTCTAESNKYNGAIGVNASTTGNVYGVYDMSGGAWEYVMGVYQKTKGSSEFKDNLEGIDEKYYDNYKTNNASTACNNSTCNGHALGETSDWYVGYTRFVNNSSPWFVRGGGCYETSFSGVFSFSFYTGISDNRDSFRVVIVTNK